MSEGATFASHLVRPIGHVHRNVAAQVWSTPLRGPASQDMSTIVLLASSRMGKTKVPYSLAQTPDEGIVPIIVRIAGGSRRTEPWILVAEELKSVGENAPRTASLQQLNSLGFSIHILMLSVYIEWVLFLWSKVSATSDPRTRTPAFFLEFVVRVLWNGTSDEAIRSRFRRLFSNCKLVASFSPAATEELLANARKRIFLLKDRLVRAAEEAGVRHVGADGVQPPAVVLFVDEVSEWMDLSCFWSLTMRSLQSNLYGFVGTAEELKQVEIVTVMMGTEWSFSRALMVASSPMRKEPTVMSNFHVLEPSEMCELLDFYFDFGRGGVAARFPAFVGTLHALRGRPSFFVDEVLRCLARTPALTASEESLISLVRSTVESESDAIAKRLVEEAEGKIPLATVSKRDRRDFVREMVLALATHNGIVDRRRFRDLLVLRKRQTPDDTRVRRRRKSFFALMHHPGFVIGGGDSPISVFDEPIVERALRKYIASDLPSPDADPCFAFFAGEVAHRPTTTSKGFVFEQLVAWHIAKPRECPPELRRLLELPASSAWSAGLVTEATEMVFFSEARRDWFESQKRSWMSLLHPQWTDEMFPTELHALFDWSDPRCPVPATHRIVLASVDLAGCLDLAFFAVRPLFRDEPTRAGEVRFRGRAVRLVIAQCKSGDTTFSKMMASLNIATMYASGAREDRRSLLQLVCAGEDVRSFLAHPARLVISMQSPTKELSESLRNWNAGHVDTPVEAVQANERMLGTALYTALTERLADKNLGAPKKHKVDTLVRPLDVAAATTELEGVLKALREAEVGKRTGERDAAD